MESLFDSLNTIFDLNINNISKYLIIDKANQSPRILSNIFRKMIIEDNLNSLE